MIWRKSLAPFSPALRISNVSISSMRGVDHTGESSSDVAQFAMDSVRYRTKRRQIAWRFQGAFEIQQAFGQSGAPTAAQAPRSECDAASHAAAGSAGDVVDRPASPSR
ncbi:MAG: hypothetical protein ABIV63_00540 [Caldimonas sp.]